MTVYIINGKAHTATHSGFEPIPDYMYYMMLEEGLQPETEVIDYD